MGLIALCFPDFPFQAHIFLIVKFFCDTPFLKHGIQAFQLGTKPGDGAIVARGRVGDADPGKLFMKFQDYVVGHIGFYDTFGDTWGRMFIKFFCAAVPGIKRYAAVLELLTLGESGEHMTAYWADNEAGKDIIICPPGIHFPLRDIPDALILLPGDIRGTEIWIIFPAAGILLAGKEPLYLVDRWAAGTV